MVAKHFEKHELDLKHPSQAEKRRESIKHPSHGGPALSTTSTTTKDSSEYSDKDSSASSIHAISHHRPAFQCYMTTEMSYPAA